MLPTLNPVLNPVQLLADCASCNKTGCLKVESNSVQWRIFFLEGEIQYADHSVTTFNDLQYFCLKQGWNDEFNRLKVLRTASEPSTNPNETQDKISDVLAEAQKHEIFNSPQLSQLFSDLSQNAMESFLWISSGMFHWEERTALPSALESEALQFNLTDLVNRLKQRSQEWQATSSNFTSPYQRPYFLDFNDTQKGGTNGPLSSEALAQLAKLMQRGLSLRQLSLYIKQDEIHIARLLSPYIEKKIIHLREPNPPYHKLPPIQRVVLNAEKPKKSATNQAYKIVCIDDSPTVLKEIQRYLESDQYQVTAIDDPVKASGEIFKLKPDLILMDITMPRINGYNLCSLLRSSHLFDEIPIIMVSGNTGLIDKARAKICGATGYLTKPFNQEELRSIIDKHLA